MVAQFSAPLVIDNLADLRSVRRLTRVRHIGQAGVKAPYVEDFLQQLIDTDPSVLPVEELEASFSGLRSVCRELPLGRGESKYLDNLLINADGRICLVECKLWRNPQAIREVVAQVLDYAGELASLSYEELSAAVRKSQRSHSGDLAERVLGNGYDIDAGVAFVDAVTRSLQLGNFLLLIVGDGIRAGLQQIAGLLQNRATLGFSLALIEMGIYGDSEGEGPYYIQSRRLLRTETIVRNVFLPAGNTSVPMPKETVAEPPAQTLSDQDFFGQLATVDPALVPRLRSFLDECQAVGCSPELKRKYVLYVDDPTGGQFNVGTISREGRVFIQGVAARDQKLGKPIGRDYMESLAKVLPGSELRLDTVDPANTHVRLHDKVGIPLGVILDRKVEWLAAIDRVVSQLRRLGEVPN